MLADMFITHMTASSQYTAVNVSGIIARKAVRVVWASNFRGYIYFRMRVSRKTLIWFVAMVVACGCAQANPLSIKLMDPTTKSITTCSAREGASKDIPALSGAVEACARQLEARGFVRVNDE